jgi:cytochrome P450
MMKVSAPNGITMSGIRIPQGVHMEVPVHSIHMDSSNYTNPTTFSPFRFAASHSSCLNHHKSVVATDDAFLGFGYGKNSCPGRFFGSHLMKVMFAYILQHYDVKHMPKRPKDFIIMEFRAVSDNTQIRIRRRK